jgi:arsenate reductase (glutaredoxin)
MAVGAALSGLKPIVEISFIDFMTFAMDAVVNQAAKMRTMFGGQVSVPMVLRTQHGGGAGSGPQHSQCLEAWFAHVPGLKVVCPGDPASAYGLLRAAIDDPDPVIMVEHKGLYATRMPEPEALPILPIGKALIRRQGEDLTIVSYGGALRAVGETAAMLSAEGIEAEIVEYLVEPPTFDDLRTLMGQLGISDPREMMRTGEEVYASLRLADRSGDALLEAIVTHPILLERPIVVHRGRAVIARPPERLLELLGT